MVLVTGDLQARRAQHAVGARRGRSVAEYGLTDRLGRRRDNPAHGPPVQFIGQPDETAGLRHDGGTLLGQFDDLPAQLDIAGQILDIPLGKTPAEDERLGTLGKPFVTQRVHDRHPSTGRLEQLDVLGIGVCEEAATGHGHHGRMVGFRVTGLRQRLRR